MRLWLIAGVPKMLLSNWHDDLYYAQAAHHILHGEWLGPYSQMTVIKAPFYAFFLVVSSFTGLPLLLNETAFFVLACLVLFFALKPWIKNPWWRLLLFGLLLYCPPSLNNEWTLRVYREFVYLSLSLFVIAFAIGLFLRLDQKPASLLRWSLGLGIAMGAFMITREEGIWIYPVLLTFLTVSILYIFKKKIDKKWLRSAFIMLSVIIWYIPILTVSSINYVHYGFFGISETLDPDFNNVINTIQRIKTDDQRVYQPVTSDMIAKASQASPLFAEMKPYLDMNYDTWLGASNESIWLKPEWYVEEYFKDEPILGAAHFMWMFRDAMQANGKYDSGKFPHDYLQATARQLDNACNDHSLDCKTAVNIPLIGSISKEQVTLSFRFLVDNFYKLIEIDNSIVKNKSLDITDWNSYREEYRYYEQIINNPIDARLFGPDFANEFEIDGHRDFRLTWIILKNNLVNQILSVQAKTLPLITFLVIPLWIINLSFSIWKRKSFGVEGLLLSVLVFGMFAVRLSVLSILDATTNMYAFLYCGSCYIFFYIFLYIAIYDSINKLIKFIQRVKY